MKNQGSFPDNCFWISTNIRCVPHWDTDIRACVCMRVFYLRMCYFFNGCIIFSHADVLFFRTCSKFSHMFEIFARGSIIFWTDILFFKPTSSNMNTHSDFYKPKIFNLFLLRCVARRIFLLKYLQSCYFTEHDCKHCYGHSTASSMQRLLVNYNF